MVRWCFFSPTEKSRDVLAGDTRTTGGAEAQVSYLAAMLAQKGHDVSLIYGDGEATLATESIAGVTCIDAAPRWQLKTILTFWRVIGKLAPDVIYARLPSDFLWMMPLAARQAEAKFIYALASPLHCDPWTTYDYNRWFHAPAFALGLHSADVIAAQHEQQMALLSPLLRRRAAHVPNLICSFKDEPRSFDETRYDAVWIGVIRPAKQLVSFLDLASALPELNFAVVGGFEVYDSESQADLEERMLSLPNLSYLGPQQTENVRLLLTQSKLLVNTSPSEGFPNTMLEAWSLGLPVVSLSVDPGGVIAKERLGRLSGTPATLKQDVLSLATNKDLNLHLGSRGLDYVRRNHTLEAVYSSLLSALRPSHAPESIVIPPEVI
jgi:glycosyltransferase involved in cell wall biosynthesis